jgi:hypothetical protein
VYISAFPYKLDILACSVGWWLMLICCERTIPLDVRYQVAGADLLRGKSTTGWCPLRSLVLRGLDQRYGLVRLSVNGID